MQIFIPIGEIRKSWNNFIYKNLPAIVLLLTTKAGAEIRNCLDMNDPKGHYFDPNGEGKSLKYFCYINCKFLLEELKIICIYCRCTQKNRHIA